jgi:cytochrome bd-type quinol oxidase subunit 1
MTLQHILPLWFFPWCERSLIGRMIQQSRWSFAIIETIHIMALAVLLGSFLIVDLRLFGLGMRQQSVAEVAKQFGKWSWVAFAVMVSTGIPMYLSEAIRLSSNTAFFYKMVFLSLAILFHVTVHRRATRSRVNTSRMLSKVAACLSLICWLAVALAGRAIAFL